MNPEIKMATEKEVRKTISLIDEYLQVLSGDENIVEDVYRLCIHTGDEISPYTCFLYTLQLFEILADPRLQSFVFENKISDSFQIRNILELTARSLRFFEAMERDYKKAELVRQQLDDYYSDQPANHIDFLNKQYSGLLAMEKGMK